MEPELNNPQFLMALLALEQKLISQDELLIALRTWLADPSKQLSQILIARVGVKAELESALRQQASPADLTRSLLDAHEESETSSLDAVLGEIHKLVVQSPSMCQTLKNVQDLFKKESPILHGSEKDERSSEGIGNYKLLQKIGEGGMGTVWMAEQQQPVRRRVALKLIKSTMIASHEILGRFEAERQALAMMNHPNIARILDAGKTPNGQPFFAMELVQGKPLCTYCDQNRLSIDERLKLFMDVCMGVQHAHQKGIIHRDLKPGNILVSLVDGKAVAKVIDFGLAKAMESTQKLTDQSLFTGIGQILGTLKYMSPEQASLDAIDIDTRTDIYALGVVLYELLTGTTPLDDSSIEGLAMLKVLEIIRDKESAKPSSKLSSSPPEKISTVTGQRKTDSGRLSRILAGDLDWIVMKALEKDRSRRYESAAGLAADILRYLDHEPITARPPSLNYRIGKFFHKNRAAVTAVSLIMLALVGGIIGTGLGLREAIRQRREAEYQNRVANEAKSVAVRQESLAIAEAAAARRNLYAAHMNLVRNNWDSLQTKACVELLARYKSGTENDELRGFEWRFWDHLVNSSVRHFHGSAAALSVAFSPDGRRIAATCEDRTLWVWDLADDSEALRKNDTEVAAGPCHSVVFSPNGTYLAVVYYTKIVLLDANTGKELRALAGHTSAITSAAFSPNSEILAAANQDGTIKIWGCENGKELLVLTGHRGPVQSVVFSSDGLRLATASQDRTVGVWDISNGTRSHTLAGHSDWVWQVCFSADGKTLASAGRDKLVKVWDLDTGELRGDLTGHNGQVLKAIFSPDGNILATSSSDQSVCLWSISKMAQLRVIRAHPREAHGIAFSPDGRFLATAGEDGVKLWDSSKGQDIQTWQLKNMIAFDLAVDPKEERIAFAFNQFKLGQVIVLDLISGTELFRLDGHSGYISSIAFSPTADTLASASDDGTVKVWNLAEKSVILELHGNGDWMNSIAFSPDGKSIAAASGLYSRGGLPVTRGTGHAGEVKLWESETGNELLSCSEHSGPVTTVKYSPNGEFFATATQEYFRPGEVAIWDAKSGNSVFRLEGLSHNTVLSYSSEGRYLAIAHGRPRSIAEIMILDVKNYKILSTFQAHTDSILDLGFSPDGTRLVSASVDGTLKTWDYLAGQETLTLKDHKDAVRAFEFLSNGNRIVSSSNDFSIKFWDARPWTLQLRELSEAQELVQFLMNKGIKSSKLIHAIKATETVSNSVRELAQKHAKLLEATKSRF